MVCLRVTWIVRRLIRELSKEKKATFSQEKETQMGETIKKSFRQFFPLRQRFKTNSFQIRMSSPRIFLPGKFPLL
jgi:hypothetical protein